MSQKNTNIMNTQNPIMLEAQDLVVSYGEKIIQEHINFQVKKGEVFIIMGPSGCGKSSLLKTLMGLNPATFGEILFEGKSFTQSKQKERDMILRKVGVLFQSGALWSSRTLAENIALPLEYYTDYDKKTIQELISLKLSLVGLAGYENYYPAEISGGMKKRAALARALALEPNLVFFDEPSAGLDPISADNLDDLILQLAKSLNMTLIVVTHDLDSIFKIATRCIYLDNITHTMLAIGEPHDLLKNGPEDVRAFLKRGRE